MAVAVELKLPGGTLEQYDKVIELMGLTPGGATAPGGLFHWVTKTDDGLRVVDVWESQERFEQFAEAEIGPYMAQAGYTRKPEITFFPVYNYLSAR